VSSTGYDRLATRLTRLERRLGTRLNLPIRGSEHKRQEQLAAEDLSPESLAQNMAVTAETMMTRLAAKLAADPAYVPSLRQVVRVADQAVRLHQLVFGEDSLRSQHDARMAARASETARNVILDWAQGLPPELHQQVVDAVAMYWQPAETDSLHELR